MHKLSKAQEQILRQVADRKVTLAYNMNMSQNRSWNAQDADGRTVNRQYDWLVAESLIESPYAPDLFNVRQVILTIPGDGLFRELELSR